MTNTETTTVDEERTKTTVPYDVIVWDDPVTLMIVVTRILMSVFGYGREKSHHLMMTVHNEGRATVWTGARQEAELYCVKLHAAGLLATVASAT